MSTLNPLVVRFRIDRAREYLGRRTIYKLGKGGFGTESTQNGRPVMDCTGLLSEVLMTRRAPKPGRPFWIESTAIWQDATGPRSVFVELEKPVPGCVLVYPDRRLGQLLRVRQGHVGIVTRMEGLRPIGIDCSVSSYRRSGDAVQERDLSFFLEEGQAIVCALRQDIASRATSD